MFNLNNNIIYLFIRGKLFNLGIFMGMGDWGLGIGDWGLGPIPNPQSPIPNPQSPIPIFSFKIIKNFCLNNKYNNYNF